VLKSKIREGEKMFLFSLHVPGSTRGLEELIVLYMLILQGAVCFMK